MNVHSRELGVMLAQRAIGKILEGNAGPGSLGIEEWRNQYQGGIENRPQPQVNAPIVRNISGNASGFWRFHRSRYSRT